jgi:hypothetical protein
MVSLFSIDFFVKKLVNNDLKLALFELDVKIAKKLQI